MAGNNFQSLLFCFFKNGQYLQFPLFADVSASEIVYIRKLNLPNAAGIFVPAYWIVAQDPKSLNFDSYYVTGNEESTLVVFAAELNALSDANNFTVYTGLQKMYGVDVLQDLNSSIVINDLWTKDRIFDGDNATTIYLNIQTDLIYQQVVVSGDQTLAGPYYYQTYL